MPAKRKGISGGRRPDHSTADGAGDGRSVDGTSGRQGRKVILSVAQHEIALSATMTQEEWDAAVDSNAIHVLDS